ncbi:unnamed protein product [Caretta caretta]
MLICVICRESRAHRTHRVVPTEEAAQAYKGKIEAERQKIMSEFEQLRQFLDEQERLLLAQLEELDKEIVKIQDENVTKLSEKISRMDIKSTWSRCEKVKFKKPMAVSQDVSERIGVSSQRNVCLQEALKKFKELQHGSMPCCDSRVSPRILDRVGEDIAFIGPTPVGDRDKLLSYTDLKKSSEDPALSTELSDLQGRERGLEKVRSPLATATGSVRSMRRATKAFGKRLSSLTNVHGRGALLAHDGIYHIEPASWNRLLVRGVVAVVGVLVLLYRCGFWKGRGKVFAYSQLVFRKLLTHPSPQPGSRQDSQEPELPAVCDRDGDQAQGTRNRNHDPALENGEGDLLMEDRRFPQEPRGRGPLGGDTGVAQETGAALPILQGDRESAGIKD